MRASNTSKCLKPLIKDKLHSQYAVSKVSKQNTADTKYLQFKLTTNRPELQLTVRQ
jgi:hypothetical protein